MKITSRSPQTWVFTFVSVFAGVVILLWSAQNASAQWTASPSPSPNSNIYYNAGNVGIGTTTPTVALDVVIQ